MSLVRTLDILEKCAAEKYAVGAFNINGLDQPAALIKRAEELKSPILVVIPGVIEKYVNFEDFVAVTARAARDSFIPVGIHLSHGTDLAQFERACKAGFTSVMYDGSKLPYEENVANTAKAVEVGHRYGVAVEGELGALGSSFASAAESMTDPALAREYVEKTGVDILAVAIGNAHGFYKGTPRIDFQRLAEICQTLLPKKVFLTLHGGTGIPEDQIRRCIELGVVKICIYTELCAAGKQRVKEYLVAHPDYTGNYDVADLIGSILEGFTASEESGVRMFLSANKIGRGESSASPGAGNMGVNLRQFPVAPSAASGPPVTNDPGPEYPSKIAENDALGEVKGVYWHQNA